MSRNLGSFVNNQTGRGMPPPTTHRGSEVDLKRAIQAQGLGVSVKGNRLATAANSAQQRQNQDPTRQAILRNEQRNTFDGSEYQESTTTSHSRVQVEDSQLDAHGRPMRYAAGGQQAYGEDEGSFQGSEGNTDEDGEGEELYEDERFVQVKQDQSTESVVNYIDSQPDLFGRPLKGDSMPPTTSGGPSHRGDEHQNAQIPFMSSAGGANAPHPPQHGSRDSRQVQPPIQRDVPHTKQPQYVQQPAQTTYAPSRTVQLHQGNAPTGAPLPKSTAANQITRSAPQIVQYRPATSYKAEATQRPTYSQANHGQQAHTERSRQAEHQNARSNSGPSTKAQSVATVVQPAAANEEPEVQDVSLFGAALDYDQEKLYKMQYAELQERSLDDDPAQKSVVLAGEDATKPLPDQLALVQKLEVKAKENFMASLSLDQWEDAGDWFLDRFGDIIRQLKDARKERRQLAKGFGDEIHNRHQAVMSKKRSIKDSLEEMGKNGASVLTAGTPKKKQKKRRV
jgi:hypothetical protein